MFSEYPLQGIDLIKSVSESLNAARGAGLICCLERAVDAMNCVNLWF